ncbi:MAG: phage tail protein [Microvirgula sp.]
MQQINTPDGLFHDGAPSTGELGTIVSASWLNSVANELENVVTGLGGTLDPARDDQIKSLLTEKFASKHDAVLTGTPVAPTAEAGTATDQLATTGFVSKAIGKNTGLPLLFPLWCPNRAAIPAGYAPADGQALSRSLYPDAWAGIAAGNVPVATDAAWLATPTERGKFTAGDGSTTFRLPDYNGKSAGSLGAVFMRGDGALSAGADGVVQGDAIRNIVGEYADDIFRRASLESGAFFAGRQVTSTGAAGNTGAAYSFRFDASRVVPTAADNRPLNVTGCWVIRLFGAVVNPGAADAAQLATELSKLGADKVPWAAFQGGNQSLISNGYQKLPGGLIVQWGNFLSHVSAGFPVSVVLPTRFPTGCLSLSLSTSTPSTDTSAAWVDSVTETGFNGHCTKMATAVYFIAIGV